MPELSDAEIVCEFMEPRPIDRWGGNPWRWWTWLGLCPHHMHCDGHPTSAVLTLDRLHEVEARLTDEQWMKYTDSLVLRLREDMDGPRTLIHLSADQKIKALASVLRSEEKPTR